MLLPRFSQLHWTSVSSEIRLIKNGINSFGASLWSPGKPQTNQLQSLDWNPAGRTSAPRSAWPGLGWPVLTLGLHLPWHFHSLLRKSVTHLAIGGDCCKDCGRVRGPGNISYSSIQVINEHRSPVKRDTGSVKNRSLWKWNTEIQPLGCCSLC